jgi:predicted GIY-YIG superfamily endonuclease
MKEVEKIKTGVYQIKSKVTGEFYIGSSRNVSSRWKTHLRELRRRNHFNHRLQTLFNVCGEYNLVFFYNRGM